MSKRRPRRKRKSTECNHDSDSDGTPLHKKQKIMSKNKNSMTPEIINNNVNNTESEPKQIISENKEKANQILIEILLKAKRYEMNKIDLMKQYKIKNGGKIWNINELGPFVEFVSNSNDFSVPNTHLRNIRIILSNKHIPKQIIKQKPKTKPKTKTIEEINEDKKNLIFSSLTEYNICERILNKIEQKHLIFGYFRRQCHLNTPQVLINICILYYNNIFEWKLAMTDITNIQHKYDWYDNAPPFTSNSFEINNIKFNCTLYPFGIVTFSYGDVISDGGFIEFGLQAKLPKDVSEITIHYKLYCLESKIFYKDTSVLNHDYSKIRWHSRCMKLSDYMNQNSFTFLYCIEILDIQWKDISNAINNIFCKP
eukprot:522525_1